MKTGNVRASGKRGYSEKGMTAGWRQARRNMAELGQGWGELEEWERDEWWKKARQIRIRVHRKLTLGNVGKARSRAMRGEEL